MKRLLYLLAILSIPAASFAQDPAPAAAAAGSSGNFLTHLTIAVFIVFALVLLFVAWVLLRVVKTISEELLNPTKLLDKQDQRLEWEAWEVQQKAKPSIWNKILSLKPISEEKDLMLDHEFDGIAELDNPTPPWFMWLFYATIFFGVAYLIHYHVLGNGPMQEEEYTIEMNEAKAAKAAFLAKSANRIDENNVKIDAAGITSGKGLFMANCVACHGDKGQGLVGPNLTDKFWIHGGSIQNIFKTIKYGVPEKGMISWEKTMTPKQMSDLSNYVTSLVGTNPPNPKAPQGVEEK